MSRLASVLFGDGPLPAWADRVDVVYFGSSFQKGVEALERRLPELDHEWLLFWDVALGPPPFTLIDELGSSTGDVWHGGLKLGMRGQPRTLSRVEPMWMLALDGPSDRVVVSWRVSLRACVCRLSVLRQLGGPRADYESIEGSSLEAGHRWIQGGAIVRHHPQLVSDPDTVTARAESFDAYRFIVDRLGARWLPWVLLRDLATGITPLPALTGVFAECRNRAGAGSSAPRKALAQQRSGMPALADKQGGPSVGILIPTLGRPTELRTVLRLLRQQTIAPHKIVIVDQTPAEPGAGSLADEFSDMPIRYLRLDRPGQCTARNAGLAELDTDTVLFLDDDDEPASDLIERHLEFLLRSGADGSCGVLDEPGAPLPVEFQHVRISDVFPTSNTMVWRRALGATVFDPAFDRGVRADGEFGLRVYASGALLLLNPAAVVFHRRAASGGLRTFGERRTTFAASRAQLLARQIIAPTEVYLALRHFGREALVDAIWLRIAGSVLGTRGGVARRLLGAVVGMILLPDTLVRTWSAVKRGKALRSEEATR